MWRDKVFKCLFVILILTLMVAVVSVFSLLPLQGAGDLFQIFSYLAVLFGIPLGLMQYYQSKKKESLDREYGTYDALDREYAGFIAFCFEHPYLDIFDIRDVHPKELDETQQKQELIAFTMLYTIFERAYLMYRDQNNEIKKRQWKGWDAYINDYLDRPNFQKHLDKMVGQFDEDFDKFILKRIREKEIPFELPEYTRYLENE